MPRKRDHANRKNEKSRITDRFLNVFAAGGSRGQEQAQNIRLVPDETIVVLDKIRKYLDFVKGLEAVCDDVEDINLAYTSIRLIYKLCESQKRCRIAFLSLVEEIDGILSHGMKGLGTVSGANANGGAILKAMVGIVQEISILLEEQNRGTTIKFLRNINSPSYESKLKDVRNQLKRAKENIRNSVIRDLESKKCAILDDLRLKRETVSKAHYDLSECCLEDTQINILAEVDTWIKGTSSEKTMWVYGHVGSGKSALFNSIAVDLKNAGIPFACFPCKWCDSDLSDVHKVLPTISYLFALVYDDYRDAIHNALKGESVGVDDVKKQSELLFGKSYEMVSSTGSSRPPAHVILIDAPDECRNHRTIDKTIHERHDLLEVLLDFANTVPWIKVLVTSRPEPDIADVFNGTAHSVRRIDINSENWRPSAPAMRHFLLVTSEKLDLNLSYEQIERFRKKASGFFLWYITIFRYIRESKEGRKHVIESILEDPSRDSPDASLYLLYQRILDLAIIEARDEELMQTILRLIFISSTREPLSATVIADIIYPEEEGEGLEEKRVRVENVIRSLSAILSVEEGSSIIRTFHSAALEFIIMGLSEDGQMLCSQQEKDLSKPFKFSIGPEETHARFFESCFATMKRELRFNMCDLEDSHRFDKDVVDLPTRIDQKMTKALRRASLLWAFHLGKCNTKESSKQVYAFLTSPMALYWIEALSLLNSVDRGIIALRDCMNFFAAESNVASIANEWERFLSAYGDALKSTPHLYLSVLSWIPTNSSLWDIVRDSFSSGLPMILNAPHAWKIERWSDSVGTSVHSVACSPNGRFFVAGCEDGSIRFWDARSRKKEKELFMTESWVYSIGISPDSHYLASGHDDNKIRLWDLRVDSALPRVLEGHTGWVRSVAFSSDGSKLVSGSDDRSIRVWDVESGATIGAPLTGHDHYVISVTFSADDTRIISGSRNNEIHIWNLETGKRIEDPLEGDSVACSCDGRLIASGSINGIIRLWDAQTYEQIGEFTGHSTSCVNSVCFSFDSKYIVSGSNDNSVRVWNVDTHSLVSNFKGHTSHVTSVSFSPDGRSVLSGSWDGTVRIWDVKETAPVDQRSTESASVSCISYVPRSNLIVSGSRSGNLFFWDAQTGAAVGEPMHGHAKAVNTLAVSSDGQWLVSGYYDNTLRIWDVVSRITIGEPMHGHTELVTSVAVSPDNQLVASASWDKTIRLWDVTTRRSVKTLKGHEHPVTSVTFSVDGKYVISGSWDKTVCLWNTRTGEAVGPLRGHSNLVMTVAVSPDGQWIASGSGDGSVRMWTMAMLTVTHELKGHSDFVTSVSFSPNGQFLISGSFDSTVRIWNVQTGEAVGDALTDHNWINSVAFAPDGLEFASASYDRTIRVWNARARTDLAMKRDGVADYAELSEEELLVQWNASRACAANNDGWVKDQEKLLLWVPWQYRSDIYGGTRLVIGAWNSRTVRPQIDYRKMFKFSGTRWKDVYIGKNT